MVHVMMSPIPSTCHRGRSRSPLGILLLTLLVGFSTLPVALAGGLIPGTFPLSSADKIKIKKNVTMNGNAVEDGKTKENSVVGPFLSRRS